MTKWENARLNIHQGLLISIDMNVKTWMKIANLIYINAARLDLITIKPGGQDE